MRKISLVFMVAALFATAILSATTPDNVNPSKKLSTQIHEMLKANTFIVQKDVTADVRFTINKEGEIVVLSVDTENEALEGYVKGRLNYQKVELQNAKEGKLYTIPVRITA
ncbi:MAG: hypothetical protein AAF634_01650 [Bacteroidota bacterium]